MQSCIALVLCHDAIVAQGMNGIAQGPSPKAGIVLSG